MTLPLSMIPTQLQMVDDFTVIFKVDARPNVSLGSSDSRSFSTSASFNANPFDYVTDALSEESLRYMDEHNLIVNSNERKSLSYGENKNLSDYRAGS